MKQSWPHYVNQRRITYGCGVDWVMKQRTRLLLK